MPAALEDCESMRQREIAPHEMHGLDPDLSA
jgi:hypothetical protein